MPGVDSQIFSIALTLFLAIGAASLTIEKLIHLVGQIKKLKATVRVSTPWKLERLNPAQKSAR
jgi:hypothetical protein